MNTTLKAIIVDDDETGRENLQNLVSQYCSHIDIMGSAASVREARVLLKKHRPDVIFLDIRMPEEDGFALLDYLSAEALTPSVVFVTAYDQYSIKAIRYRAFDYLLKPIDIDELQECEKRLLAAPPPAPQPAATAEHKITVGHSRGTRVIDFSDIVYLQADKNYTVFHLRNGPGNTERFVVSKTLSDFEAAIPADTFFRVHKSYIVNVVHVREHRNMDGGYIVMSNGDKVEVSRRRSTFFRQFLYENFSKSALR